MRKWHILLSNKKDKYFCGRSGQNVTAAILNMATTTNTCKTCLNVFAKEVIWRMGFKFHGGISVPETIEPEPELLPKMWHQFLRVMKERGNRVKPNGYTN